MPKSKRLETKSGSARVHANVQSPQASGRQKKEEYAEYLLRLFTSGEIIELSAIPDTEIFARFLKDKSEHEGITVEELRQKMLAAGIMKYLIDLLHNGQLSLTEYVNLRPDIHWVEALRMAYVGGALSMGPDFGQSLTGKVTATVIKLRKGKDIVVREIAYRSSVEKLHPLYAEISYDPLRKNAPLIVLMHGGVPGTRMASILSAYAYARKGFFAVVPSLRGRDGSAGKPDSFGKEIYDIHDAVEYAKQHYSKHVDPTNVNITGGSAGGMDSFAVAVHFPDYFRYSIPYFGTPDVGDWLREEGLFGKTYGEWLADVKRQGWPEGSISLFNNIIQGLGGMPDEVPDSLMARNNVLGAINNSYTQIHAFWDEQDGVAPSITNRIRAYYEKTRELDYTNVHLHYSQRGDPVRYLHWLTPDDASAQRFFIPAILTGTHPEPVLADAGRMVVLGFLKTKRFLVWLGAGDNAVARLDYQLSPMRKEFHFRRLSTDRNIRGKLCLPNDEETTWSVKVNHKMVHTNVRGPEIGVEFGLDDVVVLEKQ